MLSHRLWVYLRAFRVNQWIKNLVIFTAIIFSGKLFDPVLFTQSLWAVGIFCVLSSTSYLLNDIIDYQQDRKHPVKRHRPIASGQISLQSATFMVFVFTIISLVVSLFFSVPFFFLALVFLLLHFFYSLYLKRFPVIDIFSISLSFMIRTFAGEVATGYHVPIWLLLTIFFISLFMATVKRHAELVSIGREARAALTGYNEYHLYFLTTTFATLTIIAYSFYAFFYEAPDNENPITGFFSQIYPAFEARRWLMVTIPLVVYGVARYAQLLYERTEGERPENVITRDVPLVVTIFTWAAVVIILTYIL